jgi:putative ABC transport system permease protein
MAMYLTLIIAYGLIGLALAIPLGALAGNGLAAFIADLMGASLQGFRVVPAAVAAQALIAILVPLGAGYVPIHSGAKTSVEHAISYQRPGSPAKGRRRFQLNTLSFHWIPRPYLLSFRNTFRKRVRLLLTLFTLTMAGAVFIAVFNVRDSMDGVMDQLMQHFLGDVTVTLRQPYRLREVQQVLLQIPGVEAVEGWSGGSAEIWDERDELLSRLAISAPPQDTQLLRPDFVAGRWLLPGETKAMVVSDAIYKLYPDLEPGDSVLVKLPDRRVEPWQVVGIFRFVSMLGDPLAYANYEFVADRTRSIGEAAAYRVVTRDHSAEAQGDVTRRIDETLRQHKYLVQGVQSGSLQRVNATRGVDTLTVLLLIMALLAAFVGSIGLTGAMSINVLERTREIGVMRTIGAADRVIMQSVIFEALVIGLITWLLAVLLSAPISLLLLRTIGKTMMGSALTLSFTPVGTALWLAVVLVLSVVASILPARNAARLTINEVLAYE